MLTTLEELDIDVHMCMNEMLNSVDLGNQDCCSMISEKSNDGEKIWDSGFNWEEFLVKNGCIAVAPNSFWHVRASLSIADGFNGYAAVLSVNNVTSKVESFWPAEIKKTCGLYVQLQLIGYYFGGGIGSPKTKWYDINDKSNPIATIDYCLRSKLPVEPPRSSLKMADMNSAAIVEECNQILAKFASADKATKDLKSNVNTNTDLPDIILPVDQIKVGQLVDVHDKRDPQKVWPATVMKNVGGRLLLKFIECSETIPPIYEFYLSERISSFGSVFDEDKASFGWRYESPGNLRCLY
ncbi:unnamed protein product [Soboliphyme baturini]|uniref:Agenet domain-containing protein n=1 Tax=Soboliphyme baturini TaxID=241478 RepID=A0A183ING3_9BILA|nr:unnamed protein product [Soboliphyme baturini]